MHSFSDLQQCLSRHLLILVKGTCDGEYSCLENINPFSGLLLSVPPNADDNKENFALNEQILLKA